MGVGDGLRGPGTGLAFPPFDICFQDLTCSANEVNRMLCAAYILDKCGADSIVGGCDVN